MGLLVAAFWLLPVSAGPPHPSCPGVNPLCPLLSDQVAFKLGDPNGYEIVAEIIQCLQCDPAGPAVVFRGTMEVKNFGPYFTDNASGCDEADDNRLFSVVAPTILVVGSGAGVDTKYTPADQNLAFPRDPGRPALLTRCVSTSNLDYSIANFALVGNLGAVTPNGFDPTVLTLPRNVRGMEDDGSRSRTNDVAGSFSFKSSLQFSKTETKGPGSLFRFWPDGLPFRLGPGTVTYEHDRVTLSPGLPTLYESIPPPRSNVPVNQLVQCIDAVGWDCTDDASNPDSATYNGAYFAGAWDWSSASFEPGGLDVTLSHTTADSIAVYEPAFPRGVRLDLEGPATISLTDSRITGGSFTDGRARLEYTVGIKNAADCDPQTKTYEYDLVTSPAPEFKGDGVVLAGIVDLNESPLNPASIDWTFNEAHDLGCGTLMVPAVVSDRGGPGFVAGPQREWLQSLATPAEGRGIYAGVNYNRDGVCEGGGASDGQVCQSAADCGGLGTCNLTRFSPKCGVLGARTPTWVTNIDGDPPPPISVPIVPGAVGQEDREMVFLARASGVTGVFDGGAVAESIGDPPASFDIDFDRLGMAFTDSAFGPDTLLRGNLNLPWPSDAALPFDRMSLCDCGMLDGAEVPEIVPTRTLGYWDQRFDPYSLDFTAGEGDDCLASTTCSPGGDPARKVCISAVTPVKHFTPHVESTFGVLPNGRQDGDGLRPSGPANQKVDDYDAAHPGYPFAAEVFELSTWDLDLDERPTKAEVLGGEPYGWVDAKGELGLPFFGQPDAKFRVQKQHASGDHTLDLHSAATKDTPLDASISSIVASRKMAGDSLDLTFTLDYFSPSGTEDPSDGTDAAGRGVILGFQPGLVLGSVEIAAGIVIDPGRPTDAVASDFGPAGAMRLWGNLLPSARSKLETILPADRVTAELTAAYDAALARLGCPLSCDDRGRLIDPPSVVSEAMHDLGILDSFDLCGDDSVCGLSPDFLRDMETGDPPLSPRSFAKGVAGYLGFSVDVPDFDVPELAHVEADLASLAADAKPFFEFARGELDVQRYVRELDDIVGEQPLMELGRHLPALPSAESMGLPGKQDIPFPPGIPGLKWDFDYSFTPLPPSFEFHSVTGNLDLTQGGLSGLGFTELGATLQFYADGDWYFQADAEIDFNAAGGEGHILLGNTRNMQPLYDLDPQVADFLGDIPKFDGVYATVGVRRNWIDLGCLLRIRTGIDVGGWYIKSADSFGGSLQGWVDGRGACLASVKGEIGMRGGMFGDLFKLQGDFWVAAGVGWDCDEDSWDSPGEALGDGGCFVCASTVGCEFVYPPKDLTCDRPDYRCR